MAAEIKQQNQTIKAQIAERQYAKALDIAAEHLQRAEASLGIEHPETAQSLTNLALIYYYLGRYNDAQPLYERGLALYRQALGSEHPSIGILLSYLASTYKHQGLYAQAEPLYQESLALAEARYGPNHAETAMSLNSLALLYYEQQRYADAEPLFKKALDTAQQSLTPEHPVVSVILQNTTRLYYTPDRPLFCSTSIGITLFADASCNADELMKQADIAMYEAKRGGRDTWRFFESSMQQELEFKESRSLALRHALLHDELTLRYLPQVDARGHWCGCEALVRWAASDEELRRPDAFLKLAEDSGLIQAIDDWVLRRACEDFASIRRLTGQAELHLGVNVSVRQLLDTDFAKRVIRTVDAAGLKPQQVRLEVTEQSLFANIEHVQAALDHLQRNGIAVVLDDYGTGSSSLMQLQRLAFQAVKIDQALVKDIEHNPSRLVIVRAALSVATAFSIPVIAEGVETAAQYHLLRAEGCTLFQGYYFAAPMPLDDLVQGLSAVSALVSHECLELSAQGSVKQPRLPGRQSNEHRDITKTWSDP